MVWECYTITDSSVGIQPYGSAPFTDGVTWQSDDYW